MFNLMTATIRATMLRLNAHQNSRCRSDRPRSHGGRVRIACHELESRLTPATITVLNNSDSSGTIPAGSLREALTIAKDGDIIDFDSVFDGTNAIFLAKDLPLITKSITITGFSDNSFVKIDGNDQFQAFRSTAGVTVSVGGLTVRQSPGGIDFSDGDLTLSNLKLHDSAITGDGGAIRFDGGGLLTLDGVTISNASAGGSGGAISIGTGDLAMGNVTIAHCSAGGTGGAISIGTGSLDLGTTGSILIHDCRVASTTGDVSGGAIHISTVSGDAIFVIATISDCEATSESGDATGGAIHIFSGDFILAA